MRVFGRTPCRSSSALLSLQNPRRMRFAGNRRDEEKRQRGGEGREQHAASPVARDLTAGQDRRSTGGARPRTPTRPPRGALCPNAHRRGTDVGTCECPRDRLPSLPVSWRPGETHGRSCRRRGDHPARVAAVDAVVTAGLGLYSLGDVIHAHYQRLRDRQPYRLRRTVCGTNGSRLATSPVFAHAVISGSRECG